MPVTITLDNGAAYTKKQIQTMFSIQIDSIRNHVLPADRGRFEKWISENNDR